MTVYEYLSLDYNSEQSMTTQYKTWTAEIKGAASVCDERDIDEFDWTFEARKLTKVNSARRQTIPFL